jgi:SAM-dependent methyltransferase
VADEQDLTGLEPALAREVAEAMETTVDLLPLLPEILQDLPDLGGGCTAPVIEALEKFGLPPAPRVLDLGSGRGELAIALSRRLGATVTGIEAFPPFVAAARAAALKAGADCRFAQGDIRRAVEAERGYDTVLLVSVGPVFGDHARTIAAIRRTVRGGGRIVIADACLDGPRPPGAVWQAYADRETTELAIECAGDRLVLARPLRADQQGWNAHAMAAIRRRTAELAIRHPSLARSLAAYAARQEREFAWLDTGPVLPMLWMLEKAG